MALRDMTLCFLLKRRMRRWRNSRDRINSLHCAETVQEGIQLYKELDSLWGTAGMQARKWMSNSPEVVAATPEADRTTELQITGGRNLLLRHLVLPGIVQRTHSLF